MPAPTATLVSAAAFHLLSSAAADLLFMSQPIPNAPTHVHTPDTPLPQLSHPSATGCRQVASAGGVTAHSKHNSRHCVSCSRASLEATQAVVKEPCSLLLLLLISDISTANLAMQAGILVRTASSS